MASSLISWDATEARFKGSTGNPALTTSAGTNFPRVMLAYDQSTNEKCYFKDVMPQEYTTNANVEMIVYWLSDGSSTGVVKFGVKLLGRTDGETYDAALGTQQSNTDTRSAANTLHAFSVTLNSPGLDKGDIVIVELERLATDVADTYNGDALVLGIELRQI